MNLPPEPGYHNGWTSCPLCHRTFWVTPRDDCLVPACGCYGTRGSATDGANHERPCFRCGLDHGARCKKTTEKTAKTAETFLADWIREGQRPLVSLVRCRHQGCPRSFVPPNLPPGWAAVHHAEDPPFYCRSYACPEHIPPGLYVVLGGVTGQSDQGDQDPGI